MKAGLWAACLVAHLADRWVVQWAVLTVAESAVQKVDHWVECLVGGWVER